MKKRNRNRNRAAQFASSPANSSANPAAPLSKADIARSNGAKSRGPTSEAGKARSSQNAVKHGLTSKKFMILPGDQEEFNLHLAAVVSHWNPQTDYELYLVTKLARAEFQHDRAETIQTTLLELETDIIAPEIERAFETMTEIGAIALGYKSMNDNSSAHRNMDRHLARLTRERAQARKTLVETMAERRLRDAEREAEIAAERVAAQAAQPEPVAAPVPTAAAPLQKEPIAPATLAAVTPIRPNPVSAVPAVETSSHPRRNEPTASEEAQDEMRRPAA